MLKKTIQKFFKIDKINIINKHITKRSFSNLYNNELFIRNKDFAANFKDSVYHKVFYDINLQNTLNSLFLINREVKNIVFVGPNPYLFLEKLPPSKFNFKFLPSIN